MSYTPKVLAVDDSLFHLVAITRMLEGENFALEFAVSGEKALDSCARRCPDLILMDIVMPGLDGYEVTRILRRSWKPLELPIILLTAQKDVEYLVKGFDAGASDYLSKPVNREELLARMKIHLSLKSLKEENLRMRTELKVARHLQSMLLPKPEELKRVKQLDIAGFMLPAEEVGGDYYDVLEKNGRVLCAIGDATGHGLESGVIMLMAQTAVRTLLEHQETDPVKFLATLNRTLYKNVQERMQVDKNLSLLILDYTDGILNITGQHEKVIVIRADGKIEQVDTEWLGFMVGFLEDITQFLQQTRIFLHHGDTVILYTDGITEAKNENKGYYGLKQLCHVISGSRTQSAEGIKQIVMHDLLNYLGGTEPADDMALLVIKRR